MEGAMTTKETVIEMIRRLPENGTLPEIIAELYFRQKVDRGLRELDERKGVSHDEARRRLAQWLD